MVNLTEYEQELPTDHFHYNRLQKHIRKTIPRIKITSIRQVQNKYLSLAFAIKENEMQRRCGTRSHVKEYIHATGAAKIASILKENLNWRLVRRSKYGQGVSFSHDASYANKYCNNRNGISRAFVFCDILEGNSNYVYDNNDTHPPKNVDSYQSTNGFVIVKFDDFTFNPKFVVYYECGVYDIISPQDNAIYSRQHGFDSSDGMGYIRQQRSLLIQILRIPLQNEDFLNAEILKAANNKRTQTIVQPESNRLPNQPLILSRDSVRIEADKRQPELPPSTENNKRIQYILPPGTNITANQRPTVSNLSVTEAGLTNRPCSYHHQFAEPTAQPNRYIEICAIIISVFAVIIVCVCMGIIYYFT